MEHIELVVFGLLVAVAGLAVVARLVGVPYPILLVVGGLAIGLVPGAPGVELDPDLVLLIFLPRRLVPAIRERDPLPPWSHTTLVAWAGMRGAVTLAAALAIPLETDAGAPFPERDLLIFLAFAVIVATLVGQGLTMPALIRALRIEEDSTDRDEELAARVEIAFAALDRIEQLQGEDWVSEQTVERTRDMFEYRGRRFSSRLDDGAAPGGEQDDFDYEARAESYRRFMHEVIGAQRETLRTLRDAGRITDEVRRRVEYDLDLEEARIAGG